MKARYRHNSWLFHYITHLPYCSRKECEKGDSLLFDRIVTCQKDCVVWVCVVCFSMFFSQVSPATRLAARKESGGKKGAPVAPSRYGGSSAAQDRVVVNDAIGPGGAEGEEEDATEEDEVGGDDEERGASLFAPAPSSLLSLEQIKGRPVVKSTS